MAEGTPPKAPRTAWARLLGSDEAPTKHEERLAKIQEQESTERVRLQERGLTERARLQHKLEIERAYMTARATAWAVKMDARKAFWAENGSGAFLVFGIGLVVVVVAGGLVFNQWLQHTRPLPSSTICVESVELTATHSTDTKCGPGGVLEVLYLKDVERFQAICRCPKAVSVGALDAGVEAGGP